MPTSIVFVRYVERELFIRSDDGQDGLREVAVDEVVSEAIASALGENAERPEKVAMKAWLFQLARRAIDRIKRESSSDDRTSHCIRMSAS